MNTSPQTSWALANAAFRNGDFESAIALFEEALIEADERLKPRIRFNLDLALRRVGRPSTGPDGNTLLFVDYALPMYDRFAGSRTNFMYVQVLL